MFGIRATRSSSGLEDFGAGFRGDFGAIHLLVEFVNADRFLVYVIVLGSMSSEKVTVTKVVLGISTEFGLGVREIIVGGVLSTS